jgi:hypothetical protein
VRISEERWWGCGGSVWIKKMLIPMNWIFISVLIVWSQETKGKKMKAPVDPCSCLALWQCYVKGLLADTLVILCKGSKEPSSSALMSGRYQRGMRSWEGRAWQRKTGKSQIITLGGLLDISGRHWDLEIQVTHENCEGHHNNQTQKQTNSLLFPVKSNLAQCSLTWLKA